MKRIATGLLRLLIGIGFTLSLVFGATLTMLALFHGPGDNLILNQTGPDWGWGGGAAAAWGFALFCWICWRCLPAVKPAGIFSPLERSMQKPPSLFGSIIWTVITTACAYYTLCLGAQLAAHTAGANWPRFLCWCFLTATNGGGAFSGWKQWLRRRQTKAIVRNVYHD